MINKEDFYKKYNFNDNILAEKELNWDNLLKIAYDFDKYKNEWEKKFHTLVDLMWNIPEIHFVRGRIKDPEHLIKKIIRKTSKERIITINNYKDNFDDLFGIRIIHLFKKDWIQIHNSLVDEFGDSFECFDVNLRDGDNEDIFRKNSKNKDIKFKPKEAYRSVHYILEKEILGKKIKFELQVRTIYEEAFGEMDHSIRYPDYENDETLSKYFSMLNVISGIGDEMGSFAHSIKEQKDKFTDLAKSTAYLTSALRDKDREIEYLNLKIKELEENKVKPEIDFENDIENLNMSEPVAIESNPIGYSLTESLKKSGVDSIVAKNASFKAISHVNKILANNYIITNSLKNFTINPKLTELMQKIQSLSEKFPNNSINKLMTNNDLINNSLKSFTIDPKFIESIQKIQSLSTKLANKNIGKSITNNHYSTIDNKNKKHTIKFKKYSPTNLNRISRYYF